MMAAENKHSNTALGRWCCGTLGKTCFSSHLGTIFTAAQPTMSTSKIMLPKGSAYAIGLARLIMLSTQVNKVMFTSSLTDWQRR